MAPNDTGSDEGRATSDKLKRSAEVVVARACGAPQSAGATMRFLEVSPVLFLLIPPCPKAKAPVLPRAHSYPPLFFPLCFSECGFVSRWEKIPTTHKSPPDIIPGPSAPWNDAECHQQAGELLPKIRPASERTRGSDRECSILWATLLQAADERCE